uniref:Cilia- and flagella-associated protein 206 n=1 Tax=Gadus morhua TaxID=8049 RepID=A0A8C5CMP2_GADMO
MSRAQAESVIKNIIRDIGEECAAKGQAASETLVAFMVKAVVLDPENGFNVDRTLTREDVRQLVELCVGKLTEEGSPALDTLKMQVYFDMNYTSRREFIQEHQRLLATRLGPVSRDIMDMQARTQADLEELYRRIISYMLLSSGVGSPNDVNTVREAAAALQSVFPQEELGTFLSLSSQDKEQQLAELTAVVTGIRIFNKFLNKGGEGIDDLPMLLNEALPELSGAMEASLLQTRGLAWRYTALLEMLAGGQEPAGEKDQSPVLLRQALYNVRQHEALLKAILSAVLQPHFTVLSQLWAGLQDEMVLLNVQEAVALGLQPFLLAQAQLFPPAQLDLLLEGSEVRSDEQRMAESAEERVNVQEVRGRQWLFPGTTGNFSKLPLQYRGMCGYSLAARDGLLLPGNPSIGVLRLQDKYYVFSSREAAEQFSSCPDDFTSRVAERARRCPELIQLLELHHQFTGTTPYSEVSHALL